MRNISFSLTTKQFKDGTKDITRRFGWWFLKPGDIICAVEKSMGLKKGEKMVRLGYIEIISTRAECLHNITQEDVIREGFPNWTPGLFIAFLCDHYKIVPHAICNRIEFRKLGGVCDMCGDPYIIFLEHVCNDRIHPRCRCVMP